ncbi:hypothetical protein [Brevundimonas diminuta]|uniref:hypothetical protein n=1 Tax=Brevundimonas diminuta TaxID=293 RepID=UPI003F804249
MVQLDWVPIKEGAPSLAVTHQNALDHGMTGPIPMPIDLNRGCPAIQQEGNFVDDIVADEDPVDAISVSGLATSSRPTLRAYLRLSTAELFV